VHAIKKNIETLLIASKEIGKEISAEKTKICLCLVIRMQEKMTERYLRLWKVSNMWEQPK
jgi:hypothetical protein